MLVGPPIPDYSPAFRRSGIRRRGACPPAHSGGGGTSPPAYGRRHPQPVNNPGYWVDSSALTAVSKVLTFSLQNRYIVLRGRRRYVVLRTMVSQSLKCLLCGAVSGRLLQWAAEPASRATLEVSPHCPDGPRRRGGRLVCCFCGGSLFLDGAESELRETQTVFPRERRGRPPSRLQPVSDDTE